MMNDTATLFCYQSVGGSTQLPNSRTGRADISQEGVVGLLVAGCCLLVAGCCFYLLFAVCSVCCLLVTLTLPFGCYLLSVAA